MLVVDPRLTADVASAVVTAALAYGADLADILTETTYEPESQDIPSSHSS